jgi:hypothetical protein
MESREWRVEAIIGKQTKKERVFLRERERVKVVELAAGVSLLGLRI